jgi:hypothetical protein
MQLKIVKIIRKFNISNMGNCHFKSEFETENITGIILLYILYTSILTLDV